MRLLVLIAALIGMNVQVSGMREQCQSSGSFKGQAAPPGSCDPKGASCCESGQSYPIYHCSPGVSSRTPALLELNSFEKGGDGGGPSECDGDYHSDSKPIVALSTGWYNGGSRCTRNININGNGRSVEAMVVDECDSTLGCDEEHAYQRPCGYNVISASRAVWEALGVPEDERGMMDVTWSDAVPIFLGALCYD